jgi:hypothetical protein
MKAKREQAYGDLLIIKLFASNYARDLLFFKVRLNFTFSNGIWSWEKVKPSLNLESTKSTEYFSFIYQ